MEKHLVEFGGSCKGTELVADGLTKPLMGQAFRAF